MCRTLYLIALTVATNYVLECSAVPAGVKHRRSHGLLPIAAAQQQQRNVVDPNDVELVDPIETSSSVNMSRATSRNQLFDNIFKVRIHVQAVSFFSLTYRSEFHDAGARLERTKIYFLLWAVHPLMSNVLEFRNSYTIRDMWWWLFNESPIRLWQADELETIADEFRSHYLWECRKPQFRKSQKQPNCTQLVIQYSQARFYFEIFFFNKYSSDSHRNASSRKWPSTRHHWKFWQRISFWKCITL